MGRGCLPARARGGARRGRSLPFGLLGAVKTLRQRFQVARRPRCHPVSSRLTCTSSPCWSPTVLSTTARVILSKCKHNLLRPYRILETGRINRNRAAGPFSDNRNVLCLLSAGGYTDVCNCQNSSNSTFKIFAYNCKQIKSRLRSNNKLGPKKKERKKTTPQWLLVRAKSFQSCPTLCDPIDCSPPGSSVHGIL